MKSIKITIIIDCFIDLRKNYSIYWCGWRQANAMNVEWGYSVSAFVFYFSWQITDLSMRHLYIFSSFFLNQSILVDHLLHGIQMAQLFKQLHLSLFVKKNALNAVYVFEFSICNKTVWHQLNYFSSLIRIPIGCHTITVPIVSIYIVFQKKWWKNMFARAVNKSDIQVYMKFFFDEICGVLVIVFKHGSLFYCFSGNHCSHFSCCCWFFFAFIHEDLRKISLFIIIKSIFNVQRSAKFSRVLYKISGTH